MSDPAWIAIGIAFLGLIGTANAWMLNQIKGIRDEAKDDRHKFRGFLQGEFGKFDREQDVQNKEHSDLRERVAKVEMKVFGNGH